MTSGALVHSPVRAGWTDTNRTEQGGGASEVPQLGGPGPPVVGGRGALPNAIAKVWYRRGGGGEGKGSGRGGGVRKKHESFVTGIAK